MDDVIPNGSAVEPQRTAAMRLTRIHVAEALPPAALVALPTQAAEHLVRVLRLQAGDPLVVFNGDGHDVPAVIERIDKRGVAVRIGAAGIAVSVESPLRITLAQGIARGDKMDWILQKATELGVHRFVPLLTERTEVKLDGERAAKRLAHWQGVVAAACEQSGRSVVPDVAAPMKLAAWLATLGDDDGLRLSLDPKADRHPRDLAVGGAATLIVGPEGGLAPNDLSALAAAGFHGLRLGPRILRTETAGIAAISVLQALHGDLG